MWWVLTTDAAMFGFLRTNHPQVELGRTELDRGLFKLIIINPEAEQVKVRTTQTKVRGSIVNWNEDTST